MNLKSLDRRFFTKRFLLFVVTLIAVLCMFIRVGQVRASAPVSILDSLGTATTASQFGLLESGGLAILENNFVGPQFTLTQPTTLTEIGAFVNSRCVSTEEGVPLCSSPSPLIVQIHPSVNGVPDASTVLASFVLSHDNDPLVVSYESVAINLLLQPGTYFALFVPQADNAGLFLGSATSPFNYQAEVINIGALDPSSQDSVVLQTFGAVRILGEVKSVLDGCDSEVPNIVLPGGATISDLITECAAGANSHGQFVSCVSHATANLMKAGTITGKQRSEIQRCAAQADIP